MHSFWWRVIKKSFKNSRKPFETVGGYTAIFCGLIAFLFVCHFITQEWGDYMIYWAGAVAFIVFVVWFGWNFIKVPHKMYKEDSAGLLGKNLNPENEGKGQHLGSFVFIVLIVSVFMAIIAANRHQIAKLKNQLPPPKLVARQKPLPDKIIPAPETPSATIVAKPIVGSAVNFETNFTDTNDIGWELDQERTAKKKQLQDANAIPLAAWTNNLSTYKYTIRTLHDILSPLAVKHGDGLVIPSDYYECLPPVLDSAIGETNVAYIKFAYQTNMEFKIFVSAENWSSGYLIFPRSLYITCSCGSLRFNTLGNTLGIETQIPDGTSGAAVQNGDRKIIDQKLRLLVGAQFEFVNKTNK